MRILLAVQGTGNGHISRARDVLRHLREHGEVDTLVSGLHSEVDLGEPWTYKFTGLGFFFGKSGGIDYARTIRGLHIPRFIKELRHFPVDKYDLVISDFEPISAWAAQLHHVPCVAMSNQAAFLSRKTPRPPGAPSIAELVLRYFAPGSESVGFHFERYDSFIHTPIIREKVRCLTPRRGRHVTVYLPAHDEREFIGSLGRIRDLEWQVFSKHIRTPYEQGHIKVWPVETERFLKSMEGSLGVITAGGFETSAEALFLEKKLLVIPMHGQYEQLCNAEALRRMGVATLPEIKPDFTERVESWLTNDEVIKVDYPDETEMIVADIIRRHKTKE
jgi:uncharacterized protein (TIGR00661 family)